MLTYCAVRSNRPKCQCLCYCLLCRTAGADGDEFSRFCRALWTVWDLTKICKNLFCRVCFYRYSIDCSIETKLTHPNTTRPTPSTV